MQEVKITSFKFYGKGQIFNKNVIQRECRMRQNPIPGPDPSSITGETRIWKVFGCQKDAIDYAAKMGLELMVFANEGKAIGEGGKRNFIVCHPKVMWEKTKDKSVNSRCIYEVIIENKLCKLYFDLEFSKEVNSDVDGVVLTKTFASVVNYYLNKVFHCTCSSKNILDLDSTNEKKFSRHLIYNCPDVLFENNYHAGHFVKMICNDLRLINAGNSAVAIPDVFAEEIKNLFVQTDSGKQIFCDEGVYTKNRNFRIFKSTKYGKKTPLLVSEQNEYIPSTGIDDESYFLDSLVTFVSTDRRNPLTYKLNERSPTLYVEINQEQKTEHPVLTPSDYRKECPYPEIKTYIESYLGFDNIVRNWKYFSQTETLLLDIDKKHNFCHNVGREHKNNGVFYVVNLQRGIFYQKCHDPDCKDFRSNEMLLPPETMPWTLLEELLTPVSTKEDEFLLLKALEEAEQEEHTLKKPRIVLSANSSQSAAIACASNTASTSQYIDQQGNTENCSC